jgi:iron complex outermembrane recepter protein
MEVPERMRYASRCCWGIIFGLFALKTQSEEKLSFEIPAASLSRNILRFYTETGIQVLYAVTFKVENVHTQEVHGRYTPKEALALLLHDTGFYYEFQNEKSVLIKPLPGYFVPDKDAARPPPPPIRQTIPLPGSDIVMPPLASTKTDPVLEEVTITGSMLRGVFEIMSPTQRIEKESFVNAQFASIADIMQTVPQTASGGLSDDYWGDVQERNGAYSSSISLRGLGTGTTLVLVDGFRQPSGGFGAAFVDVANIPVSIIERIEIVPDGASALYGSDAIAGVANIITRDDVDGAQTYMRWGSAPGDTNERLFAQLLGGRSDNGRWLLAYEYSERSAVEAEDRVYAASFDKRPLGGSDFRGYFSAPGNILDPLTLLPAYAIPKSSNDRPLGVQDLLPGQINYADTRLGTDLTPERSMHSAFFRSSKELNDRIRLFGEARYSQRKADFASIVYEDILFVPSSNPFFIDPFGNSPAVLVGYSFVNDFGQPEITTQVKSFASTFGAQFKFADSWRAVLSTSLGKDQTQFEATNLIDLNELNLALSDPNPQTAFNPFNGGAFVQNPTTLAKIYFEDKYRADIRLLSAQLVLDGVLLKTPSGEVRWALGTEHRRDMLSRGGLESLSENYGRNVSALFTEFTVPLMTRTGYDLRTSPLEISVAARLENYSDFGNTFNPRAGIRWAPNESFKLRSSWGTSFKAPNLLDLYQGQNNSAGLAVLPDPKSPTGSSVVVAREGSNPDLQQETAATWTAGIDISPAKLPGAVLSLTYYALRHRDQVVRPSPLDPFAVLIEEQEWQAIINRNPTRAELQDACNAPLFYGSRESCLDGTVQVLIDNRLRNFAATYSSGIDFDLQYPFNTTAGWFKLNLNGLRILKFEKKLNEQAARIDLLDTVFNPISQRWRASLLWAESDEGKTGLSSRLTYSFINGYNNVFSSTQAKVSSYSSFDWQLSYNIPNYNFNDTKMSLTLNVVNVFNKSPPFFDSRAGYDPFNTDPYGRVVSCSFIKSW